MKITMKTLAANEKYIMHAGHTYNIPKEDAQPIIDAGFATVAAASAKPDRMPSQPDPEEKKDSELDDE